MLSGGDGVIKTIPLAGASALAFSATSAEALTYDFGYTGSAVAWIVPTTGL
jgi:hypothetical protein